MEQAKERRDHAVYSTAAPFEVAVTMGKRWCYVELRHEEGDRKIVSVVQGNDRHHVRQAEAMAKAVVAALPEATAPAAAALLARMAKARLSRIEEITENEPPSDHHAEEIAACDAESVVLLKARALIQSETARRNDLV